MDWRFTPSARISDINVVGNTVFSDEELLEDFELSSSHFWSFIKGDDKYSRQRLAGDLERLRSYYLDRGYINFSIESTQVSVTPDRERVLITVNVAEGDQFRVNDVKLSGDLVVDESGTFSTLGRPEASCWRHCAFAASARAP